LCVTGNLKEEFSAARKISEAVPGPPDISGNPVMALSAVDKWDSEVIQVANGKRADLARPYPGSHRLWVGSGELIPRDKPEVVIEVIWAVLAQ
jgi:hypothetical protein